MKKICKVGIFDSGIGGLTVLRACQRLLPNVQFYYLGDNGHAPYGRRSDFEITALVRSALQQFETINVDAAVLACNTATAVCADLFRREFSFPIVGMEPAVRPAAKKCKSVLVLCTPKTAGSERLRRLIVHYPQCRFTVFPAVGLAAAVENSLTKGEPLTLSEHLPPAFSSLTTFDPDFDGVVLGCTHYIYYRREIGAFYGVPVFDGNAGTAQRLAFLLDAGSCDHRPLEMLGTTDHQNPPDFVDIRPAISPIFLGKWSEINKNTYNLNIRF